MTYSATLRKNSRPMVMMRGAILCLLVLVSAGCKKAVDATPAFKGQSGAGPVTIQPPPGKGEGASGRNSVLQVPFDNAAKLVLLNIGRAYQMATISENKPPKSAAELDAGKLVTKRDMQEREVEVAYGVDVKKLGDEANQYMLAWEKTPDNDGGRMVLMADFITIKYVQQGEFEKMKKAK